MDKKKIEDYVDEYVKHNIDFQLYGNKFCKKVRGFINSSVKTIIKILQGYETLSLKTTCNKARMEVSHELDLLTERIDDHLTQCIAHVVQEEDKWTNTKLSDFLEVEIETSERDHKKLLSSPVANAGVIIDFADNIVNKYRSLFFDVIAASYTTGMVIKDLDSSFSGRLNAINRGIDTETQTMGSSLGSVYDRIILTRNSKVIKGYIWSAILDSSTCLVCGSLDGTIYKDITKVPLYPVHYRCRCFLIPFTEEIEEMIPTSYADWLAKQSEEEQRTILGKTRFQLYKAGMKIGDFVNNGQVTPLSQLKKK